MSLTKKRLIITGMLLVFATMLFALPTVLSAAENEEITKWDWKGNTPDWWKWDDSYWSKSKPVRGGYFRTASSYYIGLMNPHHWPVNDWVAIVDIYNRLLAPDGSTMPSVPFMCESWSFVKPTEVIMKLRRGIQFTDGSTFNAESVKYQMDWIQDKSNGAWTKTWIQELDSTEIVDEYTVRFKLKSAWVGFSGTMANIPGLMVSAKALQAEKALIQSEKLARKLKKAEAKALKSEKAARADGATEKKKAKAVKDRKKADKLAAQLAPLKEQAKGATKVDTHPVGSGPYMLEEAKPGNYLKLQRNPNWFFGKTIGRPDMPYFDGLIYMVIPDASIRLANFRAGKIHQLSITGEQYDMVRGDKNINIYRKPASQWWGLGFNTVKGPCKDIRIRKAVTHAIDVKPLLDGIGFGLGFLANGPYPYTHWANNPNLKPAKYDPELSKKLLAEAGYEKGLVLKGHQNSSTTAITVAMQSMLKKVGIDWQVEYLDGPAATDRQKNLEYDLAGAGYIFIFDPDLLATAMYAPEGLLNNGRYNNPEVVALIKAGRLEFNQEKRQQIYWELVRVLREDYADAWMAFPEWVTISHRVQHGHNPEFAIKGGDAYYTTHLNWFIDGKGEVKNK